MTSLRKNISPYKNSIWGQRYKIQHLYFGIGGVKQRRLIWGDENIMPFTFLFLYYFKIKDLCFRYKEINKYIKHLFCYSKI